MKIRFAFDSPRPGMNVYELWLIVILANNILLFVDSSDLNDAHPSQIIVYDFLSVRARSCKHMSV